MVRPSISMGWKSLPFLWSLFISRRAFARRAATGTYLLHSIVLRPSLHGSRQEHPPSLESSQKDVDHRVAPLNCSVASMQLIRLGMPGCQRLLVFHKCW